MSRPNKKTQPNWRPNFVKASELPDIKVIRTGFIINFIAVVLVLWAGFLVLQREYQAYELRESITVKEQFIRAAETEDSANLELSRAFREAGAHIAEVEKFYASPFLIQDFLIQITQRRPEPLIFKQISLVESSGKADGKQVVNYRITLSGEVRSLTVLDRFKGELSDWELLNREGYALNIDETLQGRDPQTGIFPYTLRITLKPGKAAPAAGA